MRDYTLAQIKECLEDIAREERQRALVHLTVTSAAIAGALGQKEATGKVIEELTAE